jgi:hypothetical protein
MHLDLNAVDRIVAAVSTPANIDRQALLADLEGALAIYRTGTMLRERPAERELRVLRIERAAQHLRGVLDVYIAGYDALRLSRHRVALARPLGDLRKEKEDSPGLNQIVGLKQSMTVSAFESLVGGVAEIFECHYYPSKAGYTITVDTVDGPGGEAQGHFIDFAYAALIEAGIPYTPKAIATALSKARKVKP